MLCVVVANQDKWTTVLDGKAIGTSKHVDYSIFHFKAHDVAALKKPITKFIWVAKDEVTEVILTDQLKDRGVNYKTAKRDDGELTEAEQAEVTAAVELARAAPQPKPTEPAKAPAEPPPATITPEAAATGLEGVQAQPEQPKGEQPEVAAEPEAQAGTPAAPEPTEEPDAPLATTKPSRTHNKKRR